MLHVLSNVVHGVSVGEAGASLEPRLSVPDFVSQLWRKIDFSPKLRDKIRNGKPGFEARQELLRRTLGVQAGG